MAGKRGRSGPPKGNWNHLKTGTKVPANRLVVGELPKALLSVRREGRSYRRKLEAAVVEAKDTISVIDSHMIDTATAATIAAGIARWVLRNKLDGMKASEVLAASQQIVKSKQARDVSVKALGLDRDRTADAIDALYSDTKDNE